LNFGCSIIITSALAASLKAFFIAMQILVFLLWCSSLLEF